MMEELCKSATGLLLRLDSKNALSPSPPRGNTRENFRQENIDSSETKWRITSLQEAIDGHTLPTEGELSSHQIEEIKEMFCLFDVDGDGNVTATELKRILREFGQTLTEAEIMDMMNILDSDGNGAIDLPEFISLVGGRLRHLTLEDQIKEVFNAFDKDKKGRITSENLKQVFKIIGQDFTEDDVERMIEAADYDKDGCINFSDFWRMMNPS